MVCSRIDTDLLVTQLFTSAYYNYMSFIIIIINVHCESVVCSLSNKFNGFITNRQKQILFLSNDECIATLPGIEMKRVSKYESTFLFIIDTG